VVQNYSSNMLIFDAHLGNGRSLRVLIDTGASDNFINEASVKKFGLMDKVKSMGRDLIIRLANGVKNVSKMKKLFLDVTLEGFQGIETFYVINMDNQYDAILGMSWLRKHRPQFNWVRGSMEVQSFVIESSTDDEVRDSSLREAVGEVECDGATVNGARSFISHHHAAENDQIGHCVNQYHEAGAVVGTVTSGSGGTMESARSVSQVNDRRLARRSRASSKKKCKKSVQLSEEVDVCYFTDDEPVVGISVTRRKQGEASKSRRNVDTRRGDGSSDNDSESDSAFQAVRLLKVSGVGRTNELRSVIESPPNRTEDILRMVEMNHDEFLKHLKLGEIEQICFVNRNPVGAGETVELRSSSVLDEAVLNEKTKIERFDSQGWDSLKSSPFYGLLKEFEDVFPEEVPAELPTDKGVRHEIDLVPGTKYCVTRQWPLPKEQVEVIDEFFAKRKAAGQVRESKSPHCSPTFCVKKATGGWRIVHAYNKLNSATIPAQTPIPRKDVILDGMQGSSIFSTIDLRDGYYQILMRETDIPLTAVSTPSGMLWEWLVMPQGLSNAPATFNRCVSHLFRSCRAFAPSYFDDIFIHSRAEGDEEDVQVHERHLRKVLELMREHKLYANIKKCIFGAPEIPVLGCYVGVNGVRADPEKIKAIVEWPVPASVKDLRKWLGIANYLHKYTKNYAAMVQPLSTLLRKDEPWIWTPVREKAFNDIKQSLIQAPVLILPNPDKPFHVVCDASDFAIGCALLQYDDDGNERVVSYQSRQLKPAERNYPVHDKELLAMKFALVKFRVYLLGSKPFIVYTDHASLRTAIKSPHLSQRMARWLSFFAEYNFKVEYKPGKINFIGDGLSRRPDLEFRTADAQLSAVVSARSSLYDAIKESYQLDKSVEKLYDYLKDASEVKLNDLDAKVKSRIHRYSMRDGLIYYSLDDEDNPRLLVPNDESLRNQILFEYHDSAINGHFGREKTFLAVSRDFYWPHMYKWIRKYVRTCDTCQRVKPSNTSKAPLLSLPIARDCWKSVSMDYIYGFPSDSRNRTGILVFVDRFSKMVHLVPVKKKITSQESAQIFLDTIFRLHGMPDTIVSDRDPKFVATFWRALFKLCGVKLNMSTAAHPETDGQTERVNRVIGDIMRSYATEFYKNWSSLLPMAEFAINNSVHASHGYTPFYVNSLRHPRVPALLGGGESRFSGGGNCENLAADSQCELQDEDSILLDDKDEGTSVEVIGTSKQRQKAMSSLKRFIDERNVVIQMVQDSLGQSVDLQKEQADKYGRKQLRAFNLNDKVLLSTKNINPSLISNLDSNKLLPRFIGPFTITEVINKNSYRLDIPKALKLHPVFYSGLLRPYYHHTADAQHFESAHCQPGYSAEYVPTDQVSFHGNAHESQGFQQSSEVPHLPSSDQLSGTSFEADSFVEQAQSKNLKRPLQGAQSDLPYSCEDVSPDQALVVKPSSLLPSRVPAPVIDANGDQRYIVDKIVDHKGKHGGSVKNKSNLKYLVQWLGYEYPSWEPHDQMVADVPDIVDAYWSTKRQ
jgi:hypothetical protein